MVKKMIAADRILEPLPLDFAPGPNDVICARGKVAVKHSGNKKFMEIAKLFLNRYKECTTKVDKTGIVSEIIAKVEESSPDGGFVKKVGDKWFLADLQLKREKISQALRNQLSTKYKSSTKAKRIQRQVKESMFDDEVDYALSQINCGDMMDQVEKLTSEAKDEKDFQNAFNMVNMELLQRLKSLPPVAPFENADDDDEVSLAESASLSPDVAGSIPDMGSAGNLLAPPTTMSRAISASSAGAAAPPATSMAISASSVACMPPAMSRAISTSSASSSNAPPAMARSNSLSGGSLAPPTMGQFTNGTNASFVPFSTPMMARVVSGAPIPVSFAAQKPPCLARTVTAPTDNSSWIAPTAMMTMAKLSGTNMSTPPFPSTMLGRATSRPLDLDDDSDDDAFSPLPFDHGNGSPDLSLFFDLAPFAADSGF
ncbi:Nitrilase family, member 2 [Seminavis robusta]|uniref:Nitrilase family, member 2 n=1 Tax=Seminavis robusta TaxID=568900 RepID=A0A9N8DI86_9STRA|nr:Nitrilase family, member 2 [Seminavis robusta]|eukprot:Sro100_g051260.1 Nitrilase family, member 2 (427) ;mRNA; r:56277-57661